MVRVRPPLGVVGALLFFGVLPAGLGVRLGPPLVAGLVLVEVGPSTIVSLAFAAFAFRGVLRLVLDPASVVAVLRGGVTPVVPAIPRVFLSFDPRRVGIPVVALVLVLVVARVLPPLSRHWGTLSWETAVGPPTGKILKISSLVPKSDIWLHTRNFRGLAAIGN